MWWRRLASTTDRAIAWLRATAEIHDRFGDRGNWARNWFFLAEALRLQAERTGPDTRRERVELLRAALEHCPAHSDPELCMRVAARLGEVLAGLGRWEASASATQTALAALEAVYLASLTTAARQHNVQANGVFSGWAAYALAKAGRLGAAVTVLERGRARALGDVLDRDQVELDRLRRAKPSLVRDYLEAVDQLRRIRADEFDASGPRLVELAARASAVGATLDEVIDQARPVVGEDFLATPGLATIEAAVQTAAPVVYLCTTEWGTLTLLLVRTASETVEIRPLWADDFTDREIATIMCRSTADDPALRWSGCRQRSWPQAPLA